MSAVVVRFDVARDRNRPTPSLDVACARARRTAAALAATRCGLTAEQLRGALLEAFLDGLDPVLFPDLKEADR